MPQTPAGGLLAELTTFNNLRHVELMKLARRTELSGARHPVPGQGPKNPAMDRLEHFPIEEPRDPLWPKGSDLDQLIFGASIAQPSFSGKPTDRTQNETAGITSEHEPPVNGRALDNHGWEVELPVLPGDPTDDRTHPPREPKAVPAVAPSDAVEIGVETRR